MQEYLHRVTQAEIVKEDADTCHPYAVGGPGDHRLHVYNYPRLDECRHN